MQQIDLIVYSEDRVMLTGGGYRMADVPTALIVSESVRRLVKAIPDLAWARIYDRLNSDTLPYGPLTSLEAGECFYIKYGNSNHQSTLIASRLLVVHRTSGQVLYSGSANDEG